MRQYIELIHKCPANNDQFTTYVNELMKHCYKCTYLSDRAKLSKII